MPFGKRAALVILLAAVLSGCAARTVRQTNTIAEAGKAYGTAMDALAGYVLDKQLEGDYDMLAGYRRSATTDAAFYEQRLSKSTDDAIAYARSIGIYRQHTRKLGEYFDALDAFVDANVKEPAEASAKRAAEGVKALGDQLDMALHLTTPQVNAISALGGVVFTEMHGAAVKRHLEQYGPEIDRQLEIQDRALQVFAKDLQRIENKDRSDLYARQLKPAYLKDADKGAGRPALSDDFKTKWLSYVKEPAVAAQLSTADAAARTMRKAWHAYLEWKASLDDVIAESGRLQSVAEQASALHRNRHKPATEAP